MNNTNQNETDILSFKPAQDNQPEVEIIGAEPKNMHIPDNFNDQKYIINNEPQTASSLYVNPSVVTNDTQTQVLYQAATTGTNFNEQALSTLKGMLDKLKITPIVAREEMYENIGLWFENTYIDEDAEEGFKIIDYDTYVEMLKLYVDAERYLTD
jgi:hypothetical protein